MTVGPTLTRTDVAQPWAEYPNEDLETGCLALYEGEKAQGTDANTAAECLSARIALEAYPAIRKTPKFLGEKVTDLQGVCSREGYYKGRTRLYQVGQLVGSRNSRTTSDVSKAVGTFVEEINERSRDFPLT
jgi:hypothetical protein